MPGGHVDERHARSVRLVASDGTRPECTGICGALVGTIQQEVLPQDRPHFRGVRVDRRRLGLSTQVCAGGGGVTAVEVHTEYARADGEGSQYSSKSRRRSHPGQPVKRSVETSLA